MNRNKVLTGLGIVALAAVCVWQWRPLFGPGTWGSGGNMVAWVICGVLAFGWQNRQNLKLHHAREEAAQARHEEQMDLAKLHQEQLKDHIDNAGG